MGLGREALRPQLGPPRLAPCQSHSRGAGATAPTWRRPGRPARSAPGFAASGLFRSQRKPLALSLPPGHDGKRNQERHNAHGTDDVRRHGKRTGDIARVRPDQADNRAHDEESDHRG